MGHLETLDHLFILCSGVQQIYRVLSWRPFRFWETQDGSLSWFEQLTISAQTSLIVPYTEDTLMMGLL